MLIRDAISLAFYLRPEPMTANEILEFIQTHNWYEFGTAPVETIRSVISQVMRGSMKGIRMEKIKRGSYILLEAPDDLPHTLVSSGLVSDLATANEELSKMYSSLQKHQSQAVVAAAVEHDDDSTQDSQQRSPYQQNSSAYTSSESNKRSYNTTENNNHNHNHRMSTRNISDAEHSPKKQKRVGAFVEPASVTKSSKRTAGELLLLQEAAAAELPGNFIVCAGWSQQRGNINSSYQNTDRFWMSIASNTKILLKSHTPADPIPGYESYSPTGTPPLVSVSSILNLSSPQPAYVPPPLMVKSATPDTVPPSMVMPPPPPPAVHLSQVSNSGAVIPTPIRAPVPQSALSLLLKASETGSSSGDSTPTFLYSPPPSPGSAQAAQLLMRLMPHHSYGFTQPYAPPAPISLPTMSNANSFLNSYNSHQRPAFSAPSTTSSSTAGNGNMGAPNQQQSQYLSSQQQSQPVQLPQQQQHSILQQQQLLPQQLPQQSFSQLHTLPFSIFIIADGQGGPSAPIFFQEEASIQISKLMAERSEWLFDKDSERQYFKNRVQAIFQDLDTNFLNLLRTRLQYRDDSENDEESESDKPAGPFSDYKKGMPPIDSTSGSTLTVVIVVPRWFVCCHVGNTRAILAANKNNRWDALFTSADDILHTTPAAPIPIPNIYDIPPYRMNLSASMGHLLYKLQPHEIIDDGSESVHYSPVLSCLPHVTFISLSSDTTYMFLLASDGLWNQMVTTDIHAQNRAVVDFVQQKLHTSNLKQISAELCQRKGNMFKTDQKSLDEVTCCVSLIFPTGQL